MGFTFGKDTRRDSLTEKENSEEILLPKVTKKTRKFKQILLTIPQIIEETTNYFSKCSFKLY